MGQHKILKTEGKKKMLFVFFSKRQKDYLKANGDRPTFAKLEDGRIIEHTEMCLKSKPRGGWSDYELLGRGNFDHVG